VTGSLNFTILFVQSLM